MFMRRLIDLVYQLSCQHTNVRRAAFGRTWLECSECRHQTQEAPVSGPGQTISARSRRDLDAIVAITEQRAPGANVILFNRSNARDGLSPASFSMLRPKPF